MVAAFVVGVRTAAAATLGGGVAVGVPLAGLPQVPAGPAPQEECRS